jgi:hypothetical protein
MNADRARIIVEDSVKSVFADPAQKLLLKAALGEGEEAITAWRAWKAGGNLDRMDGGSFRLLPLLHSNLQRLGVTGPEITLLKGVRRRAWYQSQMLLRELMPIIEGWTDEGIPVTILKGPAVAQLHYGDLSVRPIVDVDAMIPKQFVRPLAERLLASGWQIITWAPDGLSDAYLDYRHAIGLKSPSGAEIDLHWHVLHHCCNDEIDKALLKRAVPLDLMGVRVNAFDPTDQLVHACVQGMFYEGAATIRWIPDAVMVIRSAEVDWGRLVRLAVDTRSTLMFGTALKYLKSDFDCDVPSAAILRLDSAVVDRCERVELQRALWPTEALGVTDTIRALFSRHQRTGAASGLLGRVRFLRHIQYQWRADSPTDVVQPLSHWLRRRLALVRTGGAGTLAKKRLSTN